MEVKRLVVGDFNTNCYFLVLDREAAVIDPGGQSEKILQVLGNNNCETDHHTDPDK